MRGSAAAELLAHQAPEVCRRGLRGLVFSEPRVAQPAEVTAAEDGTIEIPTGVLVEAGLQIGERLLAFSDGDGRITLRRG